jgi:sec-independent protein translocase protein TatA
MGLDNPIHIAFLLILLLLVFGAKRLPEMGKSLGAGMRGFKDSLSGESTQPSLSARRSEPVASAAHTAVPSPAPVAAPVVASLEARAPLEASAPAAAPVVASVAANVSEPLVAPVQEPRTPSAA